MGGGSPSPTTRELRSSEIAKKLRVLGFE